jgi:rod shape-determining protein MreC
VPSEEKVEVGETFFTSGDDRIFPKGFPVGVVRVVRASSPYQEVLVEPSGLDRGLEAVLIVLEGVHQAIPEMPPANAPIYLGTPPPSAPGEQAVQPAGPVGTDADKLLQKYRQIGAVENHKFGEGGPCAKPPDFNIKVPQAGAGADAATPGRGDAANPSTVQPLAKPANQQGAPNQVGTAKPGVAASPRRPVPASLPASPQPPQDQ